MVCPRLGPHRASNSQSELNPNLCGLAIKVATPDVYDNAPSQIDLSFENYAWHAISSLNMLFTKFIEKTIQHQLICQIRIAVPSIQTENWFDVDLC